MEAKDFKINHDLGKTYKMYVRIKGEDKIHDIIYNEEQLMEFRCRLVENHMTDKFEFFVDFESKDDKPIDECATLTLNEKGEISTWPWIPDNDPDAIALGERCELWGATLQWCIKLCNLQKEM